MQTGEYKFNNVECIEINKPLIDGLYASALYCMNDKYILEVLAPKTLMNAHHCDECTESNLNIGDCWTRDLKKTSEEKWPLSSTNYYLKINNKDFGKNHGTSTAYRYEPQNIIDTKENEEIISSEVTSLNFNEKSDNVKILTSEENDNVKDFQKKSLTDIFYTDELKETLSSLMDSLPCFDPDDPDYEEKYIEYEQDQNHKEAKFFRNFRNSVTIPDYLENERMVIADLIFRETNLLPIDKKNPELSFILDNYMKNYVTRINLQLPFGKYGQFIQSNSEEWSKFTDKIFIEGTIGHKKQNDALSKKTPNGKKAIYIVYETIDNEVIRPIFHTKEFLNSYDYANFVLDGTELLEDKGTHGFNKYITFAGYVDENALVADLELFQLVVTFQCNKEIKLI